MKSIKSGEMERTTKKKCKGIHFLKKQLLKKFLQLWKLIKQIFFKNQTNGKNNEEISMIKEKAQITDEH
jgi:hypothetical protein